MTRSTILDAAVQVLDEHRTLTLVSVNDELIFRPRFDGRLLGSGRSIDMITAYRRAAATDDHFVAFVAVSRTPI